MFFLKDPFTDDIHGPVDAKKLKTMVLSEEIDLAWEVAKSEEGPWVNLSKVKGLPAPKVSTHATSIPPLYGASTPHVERHPQASKNTGFAKLLQEKAKALAQKLLAGSDNTRKVYVAVGLVVTTLVMAVFFIWSWPFSPVSKFEYYVWNPIVRRSSERKCFLRNKQGTFTELAGPTRAGKRYSYWEKVRYEAVLGYEINKTGSLTSPLEAVVRVTYLISRDVSNPADKMGWITRDDCVSASWGRPHERQVDGPYHYQYRNGTWQIAISKKQQALYTNDNGAINLPWPISDSELYEEWSSDWQPLTEREEAKLCEQTAMQVSHQGSEGFSRQVEKNSRRQDAQPVSGTAENSAESSGVRPAGVYDRPSNSRQPLRNRGDGWEQPSRPNNGGFRPPPVQAPGQ